MEQAAIRNLNRLANSLVRGFPIVASVRYDTRAARVRLACESTHAPTKRPCELRREWYPSGADCSNLDRYVRDHIGEFLRLWIREE
jgi:hypothetical protein